MREFLFILGRDKDLSYLELVSYLQTRDLHYEVVDEVDDALLVRVDDSFNLSNAVLDLGGVVKIAGILSNIKEIDSVSLYNGAEGAILYTVKGYGKDAGKFCSYLKLRFKKEGLKAIYKPRGFSPKSFKDGMIEFLLFKNLVFQVVTVFDPKAYKYRDLNRPYNDFKRNISIRLAKIMINLSGAKQGDRLLDPFCGMGIILQEAGLMGCSVVGVDKDKDMVKASLVNLRWIDKLCKIPRYAVVKGDASVLSKYVAEGFDAIVTEPDLGPYWKNYPSDEQAKIELKRLEKLYASFLFGARQILKVKGRIVIIIPVFKTRTKRRVTMDFERLVRNAGFKKVEICKNIRIPYVYKKERSIIEREIWVLN